MTSNQPRPRTRLSLRSNSVHYDSLSTEQPDSDTPFMRTNPISQKRSYIAVAVLCYINLLNYMDRYTIAGVLLSIQNYFGIPDSTSGLLQTVFICSFMFLAPIFGYLGDRYNRKIIMIAGMIVWIITTLGSSFVKKSDFWVLVLTRALVGTGEASYSTIAPTIIGDLFTGTKRTLMISFFYIFIPVGSPALGGLGLLLLVFLIPDPPRGASENKGGATMERTTYIEDVKYLLKNRSFVWSSLGVTAMAFVTGALAFWTPTFLSRAQVTQGLRPPCKEEPCNPLDSYIFGAITVVTGIVGVFLGTYISKQLRDRLPNADPLICAVGMLSSSPCFFIAIILAATSIPATYTFIAIGETLLSLNWAILADILLYVVVPTRRATAEALQIMVCHLLGDAGSPYLIGAISDALLKYDQESPHWDFRRLEYSILLCPIIGILGGVFFFMTSLYIKEDRKAAELLNSGNNVLLDIF
uniref:SPNS lysolipid transporter 3, sphingosine-1-phosphate (putative) n=2 Tax=Cyprinus carpio TaxID=7962 RepID=A0A9J7XUN3_CYPCA